VDEVSSHINDAARSVDGLPLSAISASDVFRQTLHAADAGGGRAPTARIGLHDRAGAVRPAVPPFADSGFDDHESVTRVGGLHPHTLLSLPDEPRVRPDVRQPAATATTTTTTTTRTPTPAAPVGGMAAVVAAPAPAVGAAQAADVDDDEPTQIPARTERPPRPERPPPTAAPDGEQDERARLRARAAQLRQELADVLARLEALDSADESTTTAPRPPPSVAVGSAADLVATRFARPAEPPLVEPSARGVEAPVVGPPVVTDEGEFAVVGRSEDDEVDRDATIPRSPAARADDAPHARPAPTARANDDAGAREHGGERVSEDGVPLAALQGALRELGVDVAEEGTLVKPVDVPPDIRAAGVDGDGDGDGDVFGSAGPRGAADDRSDEEPTSIRPLRPGTIVLVVEDSRARDRLKRHLESRFTALYEAEDAGGVVELDEFERVDAIVFIRPSRSATNQQGFARIERLPRRPRVLVISTDAAYDDVPGVDLRLPLGQKASEVARQVLDGLEQLGVQAAAG
jgi:hypothetical protein